MLTAQVEPYEAALPEMMMHYQDHWEELALDKDRPEAALAPDWATYRALDAAGHILVVTLREMGRLVGYLIGIVKPGLHYMNCLTCIVDIFRVHPSVRGRHGGVRLFRATERELRRRGVKRWFVGSKLHRDSGRLFEALGFEPVEVFHAKWIGE